MTTVNVASAAVLTTALAAAKGGDILLLAPGSYGILDLWDTRQPYVKYPSTVTLRSADRARMASFSRVKLTGVTNMTFDTIRFDYDAAPGQAITDKPFFIDKSAGIAIMNSLFDGDLAEGLDAIQNGYGTGIGLNVSASSGIIVKDNTFVDWWKGAAFGLSRDLVFSANDVSRLRSDGVNFAHVVGVLVEANHFHDFRKAPGSTDHADFIQIFNTNGTYPDENITIRGNFLNSAAGDLTQSIFIRNGEVDTGLAGFEMYYRNITIEDNLIHNAQSHGITVGETIGLTIRNNTLLHNADSSPNPPQINIKTVSQDMVVEKNVAERLGPTVLAANLVVQRTDPAKPNYLPSLYVNPLAGKLATLADLHAKAGGVIEQGGWGAAMTRGATAPVPAPTPEPSPAPDPEPIPTPEPEPTPAPAPAPEPEPTPGPVNSAPVATNMAYSTRKKTELVVTATNGVLKGVADNDGDKLSARLLANPRYGKLTFRANGSFNYTPRGNFTGQDSFTFKAFDGEIESNVATANIQVT